MGDCPEAWDLGAQPSLGCRPRGYSSEAGGILACPTPAADSSPEENFGCHQNRPTFSSPTHLPHWNPPPQAGFYV